MINTLQREGGSDQLPHEGLEVGHELLHGAGWALQREVDALVASKLPQLLVECAALELGVLGSVAERARIFQRRTSLWSACGHRDRYTNETAHASDTPRQVRGAQTEAHL